MSDNWVVQNLQNALDTWNSKLAEIWQILTQSPETFKGGGIWQVIVQIHGALQAIGYALLVLFFVVGVVKTCGSFTEVKRPEHALKIFIRFAITKGVVTYGLELMMALFNIIQGVTSTIMQTAGFGSTEDTVLPDEIIEAVEDCGFFESIPLWAVTLIGGLFITVLSFIMIMSVYGRFFRLYLIHSDCTDSIIFICRRAESEYRKKFFEVIRSSVSGGSNRGTCLHYIFIVCIITASCQSRCSSSHYGVELYWRVDFQYACTGRCGEDVRQGSEGNDGIIKNRVCMVRNRTYPVVCYEPILQCLCCHYISYFPENRNEQNLMESLFVWHEKSGRTYRLS